MQGCLALRNGVLYVGRHAATAHVRPYDLDGRPLAEGFSFRGPDGEPCALAGLEVDEDHQIWIADRLSARVRAFTLFGREVTSFGGSGEGPEDRRGSLAQASDLCLLAPPEEDESSSLLVACGGSRRHAVQAFDRGGHWLVSLRPGGDPRGRFRDVRAVAARSRFVYVCEGRPGRVQVFRDGEFHFQFSVPVRNGGRFEPVAVAPLDEGHLILACGGVDSAVLRVDAAGRLVGVLAGAGTGDGQVHEPNDLALEQAGSEGEARIAVIDRDAERVQVFTLTGRCFGELTELPGQAL